MDDNIFESKKERELQILRQRQASNIVTLNPNLKGILQRFDPDVSRATLLQLQRQRVPTKAQLEKSVGVKTAKKLRKRKGRNLRGEVARNLREQRRFERGEVRDSPEQEPRIVGEQPQQQGLSYDPEVERERIRVQALGQLQTARIANRRIELEARQLDINREQANRDRAELQRQFNLQDLARGEQFDLQRRELQAILDRQKDDRERFDLDIRERKEERKLQRDIQAEAFSQAEDDRRLAERRLGAEGVREVERLRVEEESKERELDLLERRIELEEQRFQQQQRDLDPRPEGLSQADREFLQRGFQQGLQEVERRIGESEARTQQQIKEHADRVAAQKPTEIKLVQPPQTGAPSAEDIAKRVRAALSEQDIGISPPPSPQQSPRQRIQIKEVEEITPPPSPRQPADIPEEEEGGAFERLATEQEQQQLQEQLEEVDPGIATRPPEDVAEPLGIAGGVREDYFQPPPPEQTVRIGPIKPPQGRESGLFESAELVDPSNLPQEGGQDLPPVKLKPPQPPGTPPSQRVQPPKGPPKPKAPTQAVAPQGEPETALTAIGGDPGFGLEETIETGAPTGPPTQEQLLETYRRQQKELEKPPTEPEPERGTGPGAPPAPTGFSVGTRVTWSNVRGTKFRGTISDLRQKFAIIDTDDGKKSIPYSRLSVIQAPTEIQEGIDAAAKSAIGFVGDVAGRAAGGISELVFGDPSKPPKPGEQTGGRLDPEGKVFGLGQEIEAEQPTIQPLQSEQPERRPLKKAQPKTIDQEIKELSATIRRKKTTESFLKRKKTAESREQLSVMRETLRELGRDLDQLKALQRKEQREAELQALGTVETEADAEAESTIGQATRRTNFQLYETIRPDIETAYQRGRPRGGARGELPITIQNTTDRRFKGLEPGQRVNIAQIEQDGRLGYYPEGFQPGKRGIVRINQSALEKALKDGKLKVDRS